MTGCPAASGICHELGGEFRVHAARLKPELRTRVTLTIPSRVVALK